MEYQTTAIKRVLNAPDASYWLKAAITALLDRDAVDAVHDAECLAQLFRDRLTTMQS